MCGLFWGAHKPLAPRARTLLGGLGQATLSFFAVDSVNLVAEVSDCMRINWFVVQYLLMCLSLQNPGVPLHVLDSVATRR